MMVKTEWRVKRGDIKEKFDLTQLLPSKSEDKHE